MPSLRLLLGAVSTEPILDVILAAGLTWAAHSSVAVVLLVMSLCAKGVVPPFAAFALVLGANLGTAINPVLEGAPGDDPPARRLPLGNLLIRLVGVALAIPLLASLGRFMVTIEPDNTRAVADFHTLFNLALAAAFFPLLSPYASLLRWILPARIGSADPSQPLYLDPAAREAPSVVLGGAAREALRLADVLETMLTGLRDALERGDRRRIAETKRMDDVLDRLNTAIKAYLTGLDPEAMTEADHRRAAGILTFATNLEHAGDVVERNLLGLAVKKAKRGVAFSAEIQIQLLSMIDRLIADLRAAASLFTTGDASIARILMVEKEAFRDIEAQATATHFERLRSGEEATAGISSIHLDLLRDLKRVGSHLVAAVAYPVLEAQGELLSSRLRKPSETGNGADNSSEGDEPRS